MYLRYGSPTGASSTINVYYSVDGGTTFNTAMTITANTSLIAVTEATNQTDGKSFLTGREFIFKIESTGYGEIYEFAYKYDTLNTTI
jgi:hypothetical protein